MTHYDPQRNAQPSRSVKYNHRRAWNGRRLVISIVAVLLVATALGYAVTEQLGSIWAASTTVKANGVARDSGEPGGRRQNHHRYAYENEQYRPASGCDDGVRRCAEARLRVLVLSWNYPTPAAPQRGLWAERMCNTAADEADFSVIVPTPCVPPFLPL